MTDTKELVERLRNWDRYCYEEECPSEMTPDLDELADLIESQSRRIAELEEALNGVVRAWEVLPGEKYHTQFAIERWFMKDMRLAIDAARSALPAGTKSPERISQS
jgi:hypothetical protein